MNQKLRDAVRTEDHDARRAALERIAGDFKPDPEMERLLALKEEDPDAFAALPRARRMTVAMYAEQKKAHEELEALR